MNPFEAKSICIWNVPSNAGGDPAGIVAMLKDGGFEAVWIKCAQDGAIFYPSSTAFPTWKKPNISTALVSALHAAGIAVGGWGFCSAGSGDPYGLIAAMMVRDFDLDGWGFNVEGAFEAWTDAHDPTAGVNRAGQLVGTYKRNVNKVVPIGLISWARWHDPTPNTNRPWHNEPMAKFFMTNPTYAMDYGMPMVYEAKVGSDGKPVPSDANTIDTVLSQTLAQWMAISGKPLVPIGRAWIGDGGIPSAESVLEFSELGRASSLVKGLSWWGLDWVQDLPAEWSILKAVPKFGVPSEPPPPPPPPPVLTIEQRLAALEADVLLIKKKLGMV